MKALREMRSSGEREITGESYASRDIQQTGDSIHNGGLEVMGYKVSKEITGLRFNMCGEGVK